MILFYLGFPCQWGEQSKGRALAHHMVRFSRERDIDESDMRKMVEGHGFSIANLSSRLTDGGQRFEYRMAIKSRDRFAAEALSKHLRGLPE